MPHLQRLTDTARRETEAAVRLAQILREARTAAEKGSPEGIETAVGQARGLVVELGRTAAQRERQTSEAARVLGLSSDPTLRQLIEVSARPELVRVARGLARALEDVARQSQCLSICCRFGSAVTAHLGGLVSRVSSYGPEGRVSPRAAAAGLRM